MMKLILSGICALLCLNLPAQHGTASAPIATTMGGANYTIVVGHSYTSFYWIPVNGSLQELLGEQLLYRSTVRTNRLDGMWESWYPGGAKCDSGLLRKGVPHGTWKHWNREGVLVSVRNFDADKLAKVREELRLNHPRRVAYPIVHLIQKDRGKAQLLLTSSSHAGTNNFEKRVEENLFTDRYSPVFREGLQHGDYVHYHPDGSMADSGYFRNGLRDGAWIHRMPQDGSIETGTYRNGSKHGTWKTHNPDGRLLRIEEFRNGKLNWRKDYEETTR